MTVSEKMIEAGAKALYEHWANYPACSASTSWDERCEKLPGSAQIFRDKARVTIEAAIGEREDAFLAGMSYGQSVMPKGTFVTIDSDEMVLLRRRNAELEAERDAAYRELEPKP